MWVSMMGIASAPLGTVVCASADKTRPNAAGSAAASATLPRNSRRGTLPFIGSFTRRPDDIATGPTIQWGEAAAILESSGAYSRGISGLDEVLECGDPS